MKTKRFIDCRRCWAFVKRCKILSFGGVKDDIGLNPRTKQISKMRMNGKGIDDKFNGEDLVGNGNS